MADIFVSYSRADQDLVRPIVTLLEAQGWSVWWDTRITGGERWDTVIEREITAARCVVVVWTTQSFEREWVHIEAHHGRERGILVSVLVGIDRPPFAFRQIHARDLTGWGGETHLLADVRLKLEGRRAVQSGGRIKLHASIIHGVRDGWFTPGAGKNEWFRDIEIGPEMVIVPAGEFTMGAEVNGAERPPHKVIIRQPFAIARFATTFAEWDAAGLRHRPNDCRWGRGRRPVINVSWNDARDYATWLSLETGETYRLLSEAEWEYAARAGTTTMACWWGEFDSERANCGRYGETTRHGTVPVDSFEPNPWGLYQVHGNVWEWCEDSWHPNYRGAPNDGSAWSVGDDRYRMLRGASWNTLPSIFRLTARLRYQPHFREDVFGFRLARAV